MSFLQRHCRFSYMLLFKWSRSRVSLKDYTRRNSIFHITKLDISHHCCHETMTFFRKKHQFQEPNLSHLFIFLEALYTHCHTVYSQSHFRPRNTCPHQPWVANARILSLRDMNNWCKQVSVTLSCMPFWTFSEKMLQVYELSSDKLECCWKMILQFMLNKSCKLSKASPLNCGTQTSKVCIRTYVPKAKSGKICYTPQVPRCPYYYTQMKFKQVTFYILCKEKRSHFFIALWKNWDPFCWKNQQHGSQWPQSCMLMWLARLEELVQFSKLWFEISWLLHNLAKFM